MEGSQRHTHLAPCCPQPLSTAQPQLRKPHCCQSTLAARTTLWLNLSSCSYFVQSTCRRHAAAATTTMEAGCEEAVGRLRAAFTRQRLRAAFTRHKPFLCMVFLPAVAAGLTVATGLAGFGLLGTFGARGT